MNESIDRSQDSTQARPAELVPSVRLHGAPPTKASMGDAHIAPSVRLRGAPPPKASMGDAQIAPRIRLAQSG